MTPDLPTIEAVARAAAGCRWYSGYGLISVMPETHVRHIATASPAVVLSLIARIRELEALHTGESGGARWVSAGVLDQRVARGFWRGVCAARAAELDAIAMCADPNCGAGCGHLTREAALLRRWASEGGS